tara:strand:- start:66 stop:2426 length:2361 start_codon:yes stop_codon:yes gene_type:complete
MATLQDLEEHKVAEAANNNIRETQLINDAFNAYKQRGSYLLQKGNITEEQYFKQVRDMGVQLELIGADEYPDELGEYIKPTLSITGATIGGILPLISKAAMFHPLGRAAGVLKEGTKLLLESSIGAGIGAAAAEPAYRGLQELAAPEAIPLADAEEVAKAALEEGAITGALSVGLGAAFAGAGQGFKMLKTANSKQAERLASIGAERKTAALNKAEQLKGKFTDYFKKNPVFAQEVAKMAKKEGIEVPNVVIAGDKIAGIANTFAVTPLFGRPLQEAYKKIGDQAAKRVMEGVKNNETPGQIRNALTTAYEKRPDGKIYLKPGAQKYIEGVSKQYGGLEKGQATLNKQLLATQSAMHTMSRLNNKVLNDTKVINEQLKPLFRKNTKVSLENFAPLYRQLFADKQLPGLDAATKAALQPLLKPGVNQVTGQQFKKIRDTIDNDLVNLAGKSKNSAKIKNFEDVVEVLRRRDLAGQTVNRQAFLQATNSFVKNSAIRKEYIDIADNSGILNVLENQIRQGNKQYIDDIMKQNGYLVTDDIGQVRSLTGASVDDIRKRAIKNAKMETNNDDVISLIKSNEPSRHANLKQLVGEPTYNKLALAEMNEVVNKNIFKVLNGENPTATLAAFKDDILERGSNLEQIIKNGNFNFSYKEMNEVAEVLSLIAADPKVSTFIARNMTLNLANGNAMGAVASVTGAGSLLGGATAVMGTSALFAFNYYMAQPAGKAVFKEFIKSAGAKRQQAANKIKDGVSKITDTFTPGQLKVFNDSRLPIVAGQQGLIEYINENY